MWKSFLAFLLFFLINNFITAYDNVNYSNKSIENALMIKQTIQKENENFFFPYSLRLELLKNCPNLIPILAQWVYEEWHTYDTDLTQEKLIESFKARLNENKIPITFVVLKNDMPVGLISLKNQIEPEFSAFPQDSIWMGSLIVTPEGKKQGVDQRLFKLVQTISKQFGYDKLYLYISNPAYVSWYLNQGACVIDKRPFRNHKITVMEIYLKNQGD
jgi:hypothetical protein